MKKLREEYPGKILPQPAVLALYWYITIDAKAQEPIPPIEKSLINNDFDYKKGIPNPQKCIKQYEKILREKYGEYFISLSKIPLKLLKARGFKENRETKKSFS